MSDYLLLVTQKPVRKETAISLSLPLSGGQNLAALRAAAGQNLTAVGSSHSLTETVNLGAVTAAGLIGTLHLDTPPKITIMLDSQKLTAATHIF